MITYRVEARLDDREDWRPVTHYGRVKIFYSEDAAIRCRDRLTLTTILNYRVMRNEDKA